MEDAKRSAAGIREAILAYKYLVEKEHGREISRNTAARLWMYTQYEVWKATRDRQARAGN